MLVLAILLFIQIFRGRARRARSAASQAAGPVLQQALVQFLAGNPDETVFRQYLETQRQDVEETLLRSYGVVRGSARDRCAASRWISRWSTIGAKRPLRGMRPAAGGAFSRLAFACSYEPCRRLAGELVSLSLGDPDEEVRIAAGRALRRPDCGRMSRAFSISRLLLTRSRERSSGRSAPLCHRSLQVGRTGGARRPRRRSVWRRAGRSW